MERFARCCLPDYKQLQNTCDTFVFDFFSTPSVSKD